MEDDYSDEDVELDLVEPITRKFDPEPQRENARATITYWLLAIFAFVVIIFPLIAILGGIEEALFETIWSRTLPAVTGILGTAVGFYFGALRK